jgi:hypothetical protein
MPGSPHPCPSCGAPLVLEGHRFLCTRRAEGCFEELVAADDAPQDVTPHDGPESAERILRTKESLHELLDEAVAIGSMTKGRPPQGDFYVASATIALSESLLHLGRIRRRIVRRMADRGTAAGGVGAGPHGSPDREGLVA